MNIPKPLIAEIVRQQNLMGWPDTVPAYAEVPDARGQIHLCHYEDLTIALCEQLTEHHHRKSLKAIQRYLATGSVHSLRTAGKNIVYARLYRCRYIQLTGKTDSTEDDMPLPLHKTGKSP